MLDSNGEVAAHTGSLTIPLLAMLSEKDSPAKQISCGMNPYPLAMSDAFEKSDGRLSERLLAAMFAGQNAGGDIRGMQSGRIFVDSHTKEKRMGKK